MKKLFHMAFLAVTVLLLSSCGATKKIAYFQNSDSETINYESSRFLYDACIMPKDVLMITVNTNEPDAAVPFNLTIPTTYQISRSTYSQPVLQTYLVDNNGCIDYPVIGMLEVGGLTKSACEQLIHDKIKPYMNENENPIVTVRMSSYSVAVLGEVTRPGSFQVSREKISILEALAQAGDLTIYGVRDRVKLIREDATGKKEIHTVDLTDANIVNSPYYYLQQNDVVYVEPNKVKARNSSVGATTSLWFTGVSVLVSVATLVYTILKK
jgi:polysaccharide export outer membrane protein